MRILTVQKVLFLKYCKILLNQVNENIKWKFLTEFTESYNRHKYELTELNELGSWVKNSEWMETKKLDSVAKSGDK